MSIKKSALIKENYELIERATSKLWLSNQMGKATKANVTRVDKVLTILEIVNENDNAIVLPEIYIHLIELIIRYCVSELPTFHENPLSISEQEKTLLKELIDKLEE